MAEGQIGSRAQAGGARGRTANRARLSDPAKRLPKLLNVDAASYDDSRILTAEPRMRCPVPVRNERKILCVFPGYTPSFGTFQHAYKLMYGVKAFMPPQGLLLIAAYMPESWPVRFIDENITPATATDFAWADVVLVTGMHVQAEQIRDIQRRAKAAGKVTVLGGPSVSSSPEM
jgi:hypothetical protein